MVCGTALKVTGESPCMEPSQWYPKKKGLTKICKELKVNGETDCAVRS